MHRPPFQSTLTFSGMAFTGLPLPSWVDQNVGSTAVTPSEGASDQQYPALRRLCLVRHFEHGVLAMRPLEILLHSHTLAY